MTAGTKNALGTRCDLTSDPAGEYYSLDVTSGINLLVEAVAMGCEPSGRTTVPGDALLNFSCSKFSGSRFGLQQPASRSVPSADKISELQDRIFS